MRIVYYIKGRFLKIFPDGLSIEFLSSLFYSNYMQSRIKRQQFFFYWFAFKWYVKLNITFPWKALAQTIGNCIPMAVFAALIKPHIENVALLIITAVCSGLIYLGFLYINNVFDNWEKSLFVRAQPKLAPLLRVKRSFKF